MPSVELTDVSKTYGRGHAAVDQVSLKVGEGELLVLVGPSGCGKSTLLRMIAGLEEISAGTIRIGERVVTTSRRATATSRWCSRTTRCTRT
jgi:multiple sugar transport system ATP-binding protein